MRRLIMFMVCALVLLVLATGVCGQDILVPAGTLLQCTMEEPNFSSATASVGDPVLCHLKSFQEFGHTVFPRGSMLAGHLEADKEPGHFVGKGYLKITFDRVIVPTGDVPLPAKIIQAKGYKVDKQGDIKGNGHATRDVVEWMIPPLWPWKVLTLPARGPRPTIKGEEPMELRLMDDIVVPRNLTAAGNFSHFDRPPYASSNSPKPAGLTNATPTSPMQQTVSAVEKPTVPPAQTQTLVLTAMPASQTTPEIAPMSGSVAPASPINPPATVSTARMTMLVLKSNQVLEVTKYRMDGGVISYQELNGKEGSVPSDQIDWRQTTQMTSEVRSVDLPVGARQLN